LKGIGEDLQEMAQLDLLDCYLTIDGSGRLWAAGNKSEMLWMAQSVTP